jgi:hypothetical protein
LEEDLRRIAAASDISNESTTKDFDGKDIIFCKMTLINRS